MGLTQQSVCTTACAKGGQLPPQEQPGKEASLVFYVLQPGFGLAVLAYSKSP